MPVFLSSLAVDLVVIAVDREAEYFRRAGLRWHENLPFDPANRSVFEKSVWRYNDKHPTAAALTGTPPNRIALRGAYS